MAGYGPSPKPRPPAAASACQAYTGRRSDAADNRWLRELAACRQSASLASGTKAGRAYHVQIKSELAVMASPLSNYRVSGLLSIQI
jgi:hypothetical protein